MIVSIIVEIRIICIGKVLGITKGNPQEKLLNPNLPFLNLQTILLTSF